MGAWSALLVLAVAVLTFTEILDPKKSHFNYLTDFAMFGAVVFETMAVVSIFVFRRTMPDAERPYRCWGYPVVPALYVILPVCMVANYFVNERAEALGAVGIIAVGVVVYYALGLEGTRPKAPRPADLPPGASLPFESTVAAEEATADQRATTGPV